MKTLNFLNLILFYFLVINLNSQSKHFYDEFNPLDIDNSTILNQTNYDNLVQNNEPIVFNLYFYGLTLTDTSVSGWDGGGSSLTETKALQKTADLNMAFNQYNTRSALYLSHEYTNFSLK